MWFCSDKLGRGLITLTVPTNPLVGFRHPNGTEAATVWPYSAQVVRPSDLEASFVLTHL